MPNRIFDTEIRFKADMLLRKTINEVAEQRSQSASELARNLLRDGLRRLTATPVNPPDGPDVLIVAI